jgi:hypothetical protein
MNPMTFKKQQEGIKLQQKADAFSQKYQTRQQQRAKELAELSKYRGKYTQEEYDRIYSEINDRTKTRNHPRRQRVKHIPRTQQPGCLIR